MQERHFMILNQLVYYNVLDRLLAGLQSEISRSSGKCEKNLNLGLTPT